MDSGAHSGLHRSVELTRGLFTHLERIQGMQSAIAMQHQALENVELGVEGHFKAKPPSPSQHQQQQQPDIAGRPDSSSNTRHHPHPHRNHSGISGLQEPHGSSSESVRQQFLNRQAAVSGLMNKLSDLSVSLTEIHNLGLHSSSPKLGAQGPTSPPN
ncbi:hypothetical protein PCASD_11272 [Puccinia coronata f. sp. avenae]|uniref:Uncharacterized protein n=1 Tax=Puccinia coronata f. sp. avenae TaxID=200324 RepID=A0A2N5UJ01_9BASI|nr:hypothetical protein PCASD_11272 [Puccinia coronata f. sp. avenae]